MRRTGLGRTFSESTASPARRFRRFDGLILVNLPSRYSEYAGFANATWHLAPKFDLTAGGRWSHNKQTEVQNTDGPLAGGASSFGGHSSDSVFTYSIAPTFKPNDNTRIYARIAKGYRPGGPNAVSPLAPADVPRQFGPDTTTNYEIGLKTQTGRPSPLARGHRLPHRLESHPAARPNGGFRSQHQRRLGAQQGRGVHGGASTRRPGCPCMPTAHTSMRT